MKRFSDFIYEATETGMHEGGSRESEWNKVLDRQFNMLTLMYDKDVKLYLYPTITYYLTDLDNKYLGHVEIRDGKVGNSFSNMRGGFYNKIFQLIFEYSSIKEILSDVRLSSNVIKAYQNLSRDVFDVEIKTRTDYISFSRDKLLEDYINRISIKLKPKGTT